MHVYFLYKNLYTYICIGNYIIIVYRYPERFAFQDTVAQKIVKNIIINLSLFLSFSLTYT